LLKNHSGSYKASGVFDRPKTKAYRWNEGVIGMQAGGTRMIKIPPELGYGAKAVEDVIPHICSLSLNCLRLNSLKDQIIHL
jgi:hypothetical protein